MTPARPPLAGMVHYAVDPPRDGYAAVGTRYTVPGERGRLPLVAELEIEFFAGAAGHREEIPDLVMGEGLRLRVARCWCASRPELVLEWCAGEISIRGIERVGRGLRGAVADLLAGLPLLRRFAATGGRPPGPPPGAEEAVRRAEDLKRQHPRLGWAQIAGRLGVPERSLARWRARFAS